MRDIAVTVFILSLIPFILRSPFVGLLAWVWVGIMNPHRLAWDWAYALPFSLTIACAILISLLTNRDKLQKPPPDAMVYALVAFVLWLSVSPLVSLHPEYEYPLWSRAMKIQIMVLVALLILKNRKQLDLLTLVLAFSVGFFAVKGGIFTLAESGEFRVWGPADSFIEDNNALALATLMVVPLLRYLQLHGSNRWLRIGCLVAMPLCVLSAVGSYSRGALIALLAMMVLFALKSRFKIVAGVLVCGAIVLALMVMPEQWYTRMSTIETYDVDTSAQGRINAWWMAWNLAKARFPIGGGFAIYEPDVFARYAPNPADLHAAHSIYFQVLGEHGFIGLALFLLVFLLAWRSGSWTIRHTRNVPELAWAHDFAKMLQVSLFGFAVGGAFLSLTYFDLPYYLAVMLVITRAIVGKQLASQRAAAPARLSDASDAISASRPKWQP